MNIQTSDGIDIYCLPDCAKCKFTGEHVEEMDECPCCDSGICTPDVCDHYFEDWEEDSGMTNKEAIEILRHYTNLGYGIVIEGEDTSKIVQALSLASKALEERPQGEWIRKVDDVGFISHICSKCGVENEVEDPIDDKFCFNCGAKMKGDNNG